MIETFDIIARATGPLLDQINYLITELATARRQLAEREAECERLSNRVYSHEAIWTDQCNDDAKKRAQELADSTGRPCEVNVHGSKQFTAYPSRIKELQREVEKLLRGNLEEVRAIVRRDFREAEERVTDKSATDIADLLVDAGVITSNACTWVLGMASKYLRDLTAEVSRLTQQLAERDEQLKTLHSHVAESIELLGVDPDKRVLDSWTLREECDSAKRKIERLTRERDEARDENGQLQGQLLCDNEKRLIRKLIEEHGVVDETLWSALVRERDTLQAKLDRVREWMMQERDSWAGKNADRHWQMNRVVGQFDELAALLSDAAEREE